MRPPSAAQGFFLLTPIVLDPWRTGLTFQAVRGRLRKLRQRLGPRVLRPSVRRYVRTLALAQEGLRPAQVAAPPARGPAEIRERDGRIIELCGAGLWPGEIAARTGLKYIGVYQRLRRLARRGLVPAARGPAP